MSKKTALLIVDVQVMMFTYDDGALYDGEKVLDNIHSLLEKARASKTPVFFVQHNGSEDGEFGKGKPAWQIHPQIAPLESEKVIEKTTCDSFSETTLHEELQNQGIEKLIIVGMQTEYCIDTTVRRAFSIGYESVLVKDAHSTFDGPVLKAPQIIEHHNNIIDGRFALLKMTNEIEF
ncbi:cysteine hydrolase family protein [Wukongibacter baidiensis]|uniref:cysteine hydrolase family protein n=1 Tax=Wukongibacter baidiensis TaxID=1723361 RepID=UPI003D7F79B6